MQHLVCNVILLLLQANAEAQEVRKQGALMHVAVAGAQARLIVLPIHPVSTLTSNGTSAGTC